MYSVICKVKEFCELAVFPPFLKTGDFFTYDAVFGIPEDFDPHLPCCDRKHANGRGLKIHEEVTL